MVNQLVLFCSFYNPSDLERRSELEFCLERNLEHPGVRKVLLFLDHQEVEYPSHEKIRAISLGHEMTFAFVFDYAAKQHAGDLCMLINNDIFLDQYAFSDLNEIQNLCSNLFVLSLSRHEYNPSDESSQPDERFSGMLFAHTQDAWIWKSPISVPNSDFPLGILGCDNAINDRFRRGGYQPINLGMRYIIHHYDFCRGKTSANYMDQSFRDQSREVYPEEEGQFLLPDFDRIIDASLDVMVDNLGFSKLEKYQLMCEIINRKIRITNR